MTDTESTKWNPPIFSGKNEDWTYWEHLMKSDLRQAGCDDLLEALDDGTEVPTADETHAANSRLGKIKSQNKKAFGRLLRAFDVKDDLGKAAFDEVIVFEDVEAGYKDGNFISAWKTLKDTYHPRDYASKARAKEQYQEKKMGYDEKPRLFITELTNIKKQMGGGPKSEQDFISDILAKLPGPKGKEKEGPYALTKKLILQKIEDDSVPSKLSLITTMGWRMMRLKGISPIEK